MAKGKGQTGATGRPPEYDREAICEVICGCLAQGKALAQILTADGMPSYAHVMRWLSENETFRENYTRARESSADFLADEIVYIADTEPDPQVAKVRIDARKWVAAKMKPKKYGEKIEVDNKHSGEIVTRFELVPLERG